MKTSNSLFSLSCRQCASVACLIVALFVMQQEVIAAEYYGDADSDKSAGGYSAPEQEQFAPEGYNPYLPSDRYPQQRQYYVPAPVVTQPLYPQSPLLVPSVPMQPPTITAPVPGSPGTYYTPPVNPGFNMYSPGLYAPGLYSPGSGVFPGYFYPFNNSQGVLPAF